MIKHRYLKLSCLSMKVLFPCHGFIDNEIISFYDLLMTWSFQRVRGVRERGYSREQGEEPEPGSPGS